MTRGDVSLADLYRAFHELMPDDEATESIVRLLCMEGTPESTAPRLSGGFDSTQAPARRQSSRVVDRQRRAEDYVVRKTIALTGPVLPAQLKTSGTDMAVSIPPSWLEDSEIVALPVITSAPRSVSAPPPLFAELRQRAIVGAALAMRVPEGDLDIENITEMRATLQAFDRFPRLPVPTVRNGVQLLLDHADSMTPYAQDREGLASAIADTVGKSRVSLFRFHGCPTREVVGPPSYEPKDWHPPPRGTPIALVSDLSIGSPLLHRDRADRGEWLAFANRARAAGCPVVGFVPFAPHRWDRVLANAMTLVQWDRATTVRTVRRAVAERVEAD